METDSSHIKVNIREIAVGGAGVGEVCEGDPSLLGITAFVPFAARGETVVAKLLQRKERYVTGELLSLVRPSEDRVEPTCEYFAKCGGCDLQHISYSAQLAGKLAMIEGALRSQRIDEVNLAKLQGFDPSPPFKYRRRVTLHIDSTGRVGFYRAKSRSVVGVDECSIADRSINQIIGQLPGFAKLVAGKVSTLILESDRDGVVALAKAPYKLSQSEIREVTSAGRQVFDDLTIVSGNSEVGGYGRKIVGIELNHLGSQKLSVPVGEFSQVNKLVNIDLVSYVLQMASASRDHLREMLVEDLYSGAGNFSIPLAKLGAQVVAVEANERLSSFCASNAQAHGVERHVETVGSSVEKYLKQADTDRQVDLVVADPPRSGLSQLVKKLGYASRLILVSCQLPSFVRDLRLLLEDGWILEEIKPFDMFAQTSHVEIVGVFTREGD